MVGRSRWLSVAVFATLTWALSAPPLHVRVDGDFVRVTAPQLRFLSGRTLEHLLDGASVPIVGQISLSTVEDGPPESRGVARFALSYDIWEEKFSVTRIQQTRHTFSHLSLDAAQNQVIDNLVLGTSALPPDRPFWIRLELRVEDPRDGLGIVGDPGINLTRLVEIFSRPPGASQPRWTVQAGPFHLADLRPRLPRSG